jgi:hypothetical protein
MALRWEPTDAITVDYAHDRSKLDERAAVVQALVGLTPLALSVRAPASVTPNDRMTALNGYIAAGDAAVNYGAGPLAAAAGDPTFMRWLNSARALRTAFMTQTSAASVTGRDEASPTRTRAPRTKSRATA